MLRAVFASVILAVATVCPAWSDELPRDIYLGHSQAQDSAVDPAAALASEFRRSVSELSGGKLKVGIFPAGQLGGNRDMARLVAEGRVHSALVTVGGIAPLYPLISVTGMPFALNNVKAAYAVYDGPFGQALAADMERKTGLVVLGFGDAGGMHVLTNSRRPIHTPADMAGLKIRAIPGYKVLDAMIRGLGAVPVNVSSREEFQSLEAMIVDGQTNPASVVQSRRYYYVQSHATLTGHLYAPYVWIYNREAFEQLTPAEQAILREAARRAVAAGRALGKRLGQGEDALLRSMRVYTPTPSERDAFKAACQPPVREALAKTLGEEGLDLLARFVTAAAEANANAGP
jgi:tripartite ATP-independent transporter DctP family solute receptor